MSASAERTLAKNAAWVSLQPLVMNLLSVAATRYIAGRLGVADFGRFNLGLAFVATFGPLTSLGLRPLAIRHVAQNRDTAAAYLGQVLVLRTLLALLTAMAVIAAAPLSGGSSETRVVIMIAALSMVISTAQTVFIDAFQAFELMRPASVANFLGGLLLTIVSVVVIRAGGGMRELALAYVLGPLGSLVLLCCWSWRQPFCPRPSWDLRALGGMLRQASPFFLITLLSALSIRLDMIVLTWVVGETHLGCYAAAQSLVERAEVLADGAGAALLPAIAHLVTQSPEVAVALLRKATLWVILISLPMAAITVAFSPLIVKLIFGPQFTAAAPILAVGIWRVPALCLSLLALNSLFAVKRQDLVLRTAAIATVASIAFIYPLVHAFGALGGAMALITQPLLVFLLRIPAMSGYFPRLWPWSQLLRVAAALALMMIPLSFIPALGPGLMQIVLLPTAAVVYVASLTMMRVISLVPLVRRIRRHLGNSPLPCALSAEPGSSSD